MKHKQLSVEECEFMWDAVHSITENLEHPKSNAWAFENCLSYDVFTVGPDEVAIFRFEDKVVIGINGSDNDDEEWRRNLTAYPIKKGCLNGFYDDGIVILTIVMGKLTHEDLTKTIFVSGHSRGGGLGQVVADNSGDLYGVKIHAVTYGSLRVFTWWKALLCRFTHTRVFSQGDPVDNIPPSWFFPGFKHYETQKVKIKNKAKDIFTKEQRKAIRKNKDTNMVKELVRVRHGDYGFMIRKFLK